MEEHLLFATNQGRVLYSFNRGDFFRLHSQYAAEGKSHAGILLTPTTLLGRRTDASRAQGHGAQIGC